MKIHQWVFGLAAVLVVGINPIGSRAEEAEIEWLEGTVVIPTQGKELWKIGPELFGLAVTAREQKLSDDPRFQELIKTISPGLICISAGGMGNAFKTREAMPNWDEPDRASIPLMRNLRKVYQGPLAVAFGGPPSWVDITKSEDREAWGERLASVVDYWSKNGVKVDYIEFWIEPNIGTGPGSTGKYKPQNVFEVFNAVSSAIKKKHPEVKMGGSSMPWPYPALMEQFMKQCGEHLDFVSYHEYGTGNYDMPTKQFMTGVASKYGAEAKGVVERTKRLLPGRNIPIFLSEYNMNYGWDPGEKRQTTEIGAVFMALSMAYAGENGLRMSAYWNSYMDGQFGIIRKNSEGHMYVSPAGNLMGKLVEWVPGDLLASTNVMDGESKLPVKTWVTRDPAAGTLTLLAINYSENKQVTIHSGFSGMENGKVEKCEEYILSAKHPQGKDQNMPLVGQMMDIDSPPMSVLMRKYTISRQ